MIEIGLKHTSELTVTDTVTAIKMGSGDMPVLATPAMMALMENAAMLATDECQYQQGSFGYAPLTCLAFHLTFGRACLRSA